MAFSSVFGINGFVNFNILQSNNKFHNIKICTLLKFSIITLFNMLNLKCRTKCAGKKKRKTIILYDVNIFQLIYILASTWECKFVCVFMCTCNVPRPFTPRKTFMKHTLYET